MVFIISKLLWIVLEPANLLVILLLLGLWRMVRTRRHSGMALVGFAAWSLLAVAVLPVAQLTILPLEQRFPQLAPPDKVDGIVLLGGALDPGLTLARGRPSIKQFADRITATMALARRYPSARIVVSGGSGEILPDSLSEADATRDLLTSMGLPADRIVIENRSRTTYENAVFSKAMAAPKPGETWLLVTSAAHMPRAMGCFRHASWPVTPYPVDYRTKGGFQFGPITLADNLVTLNTAVHEWIGLAAYRLLGRTDAFFPGP